MLTATDNRCSRCGGTYMREYKEKLCIQCGHVQGQELIPPCEPRRGTTTRYDQVRTLKARTTLGRSRGE